MRSIRRNLVTGLVAATGLLLGPMAVLGGPAGADSSASPWALQTTPNPSGSTFTTLQSVSCSSASSCEAVGSAEVNQNEVPLAESWNGSAWSTQPAPLAAGSVSCAAANACMAVGLVVTSDASRVLSSEFWNGTAWSVQPIAAPAGTTLPLLNSVSCAAANSCEAVGHATGAANAPVLIAESWNGTTWTVQSPILPAGDVGDDLASVSCAAANSCEAVGSSSAGPGVFGGLAELWNGTAWTLQPVPSPTSTLQSGFSGVSCPSASSCTAVGSATVAGPGPLVTGVPETGTWNGSAWSVQALPAPAGQQEALLESVSCPSPSSCEAVGTEDTQQNSFGQPATLAYSWNGLGWTQQDMPPSDITELTSVSCTTTCEAVGADTTSGPGPGPTGQLAEVDASPATTLPVSSNGLTSLLSALLGLVVSIVGAL